MSAAAGSSTAKPRVNISRNRLISPNRFFFFSAIGNLVPASSERQHIPVATPDVSTAGKKNVRIVDEGAKRKEGRGEGQPAQKGRGRNFRPSLPFPYPLSPRGGPRP